MKDRIVPEKEIVEIFLLFCDDIGVKGDTPEDLNAYMEENDIHIQKVEDEHLIYFIARTTENVYYSKPILKYIVEPDKEPKFWVLLDEDKIPVVSYWLQYGKDYGKCPVMGPLGHKMIQVSDSYSYLLEYNFKTRRYHIPTKELSRDKDELFCIWRTDIEDK